MKIFLDFDIAAAARGEGLRPELRALFERAATSPFSDIAKRNGMFGSLDPIRLAGAPGARKRIALSASSNPPGRRAESEPRSPACLFLKHAT